MIVGMGINVASAQLEVTTKGNGDILGPVVLRENMSQDLELHLNDHGILSDPAGTTIQYWITPCENSVPGTARLCHEDDLQITGITNGWPFPIAKEDTVLPFTITNVKAPRGSTYEVTFAVMRGGKAIQTTNVMFADTISVANPIPEFPAVALPIAGIFGLVALVMIKRDRFA